MAMHIAAADRSRLLLAAAVVVVIGVVAAAAVLLRSPDAEASGRGPTLKIAVVAPPPPAEIVAGDVMEVGGVVDGYVHRDMPQPTPVDALPEWAEDWPVGPPPSPPVVSRPVASPVAVPTEETPRDVDSLGLGFGPVAEPERPPIRMAPPERMPGPAPVATATGERSALFY